jgi:hypothetical protein
MAGPTIPPVVPCRTSAAKTSGKLGHSARMSADAAMATMPTAARTAFPPHRVGERSAGDLRDHAGERPRRERKAHVLLRPAQSGQIESQERAEAHLHVGHEEVGPIEAAAALVGDFPIPLLPCPPMLRDQTTGTRGKTRQPLQTGKPLPYATEPASDFGNRRASTSTIGQRTHLGFGLAARATGTSRRCDATTSSANFCKVARSQALVCRSFWPSL